VFEIGFRNASVGEKNNVLLYRVQNIIQNYFSMPLAESLRRGAELLL
jgi:hypothetical protein